ncbi:MAG: hypothetical protein SXG53_18015, partial [Pseudomonadota bacterium]|nr:hypothetical protein [Pseudomonadota bacterium]
MSAVPDSAVGSRVKLAGTPQPRLSQVKLPDTSIPPQTATYDITPPLLFNRQSALAASYFSLRAAAPAAVSILTLYVLAELTGTATTDYFGAVTIVVTILSITLLQSPRTPTAELITPRRVVSQGLLVRWVVLLLALATIGYIAGYPPAYSLPVILLWAVATPAILIPSTLVLDEIARRVLCRPSNGRKVV